MKKNRILLIAILLIFMIPYKGVAQEDKTVTLTVSAQGQTISEAKQNALRDVIEQAFGAFISSNTEILNDALIKDEIVSVSNGNIQDYEVISEVELPNGSYAATLKATVSVTKLTSFAESKGANIEFKGGLFAVNMMQQELNEKAELKAVNNIIKASKEILKNSFDYSIESSGSPIKSGYEYKVPITIKIKLNENFDLFRKYFNTSMRQLSMSTEEIKSYRETGKSFDLLLSYNEDNNDPPNTIYFRNQSSITAVNSFIMSMRKLILNFEIRNGVNIIIGSKLIPFINKYRDNDEVTKYYNEAEITMIDFFRIFIASYDKYGYHPGASFPSLFMGDLRYHKSSSFNLWYGMPENCFAQVTDISLVTQSKRFKLKKNYQKEIHLEKRNIILNFFNFYSQELTMTSDIFTIKSKDAIKIPEEFFKEKSIIWINFNDTKTLDEIKQISEYTIKPISD